jgi:hypothetical protein
LDRDGNVFGGFTPVEWESRPGSPFTKADDSLRSFLFTLKNPHNIPARRFPLKAEEKERAIWCDSAWGPCLGNGGEIAVFGNCNANTHSFTGNLGIVYINDIGHFTPYVFTSSWQFQVKEIEVFEIIE